MRITNYNFWDIVLWEFAFTDQSWTKKRPFIILIAQEQDYLVVFITSQTKKRSVWDIPIKKDLQNNLATNWYIRTRKIATLHEDIIYKKIWVLAKADADLLKKTLISNMESL